MDGENNVERNKKQIEGIGVLVGEKDRGVTFLLVQLIIRGEMSG